MNNKNKGFVGIIAAIIIVTAILGLGAGATFYMKREKPKATVPQTPEIQKEQEQVPEPTINTVDAKTKATVVTQVAPPDPIQAYSIMKQEFDNATSLAQYGKAVEKYASSDVLPQVKTQNDKVAQQQLTEDYETKALQFLQKYPVLDWASTTKEISGNQATVYITLKSSPNIKGTIKLVLENNVWKLQLETWVSSF